MLIRICLEKNIACTLENPWGSLLWKFHPIAELLRDPRCYLVVFDACMYGSPYRKGTAILTNRPELLALARRCNGQHRHEQLRGAWKVKRGDKWVYENKTPTAGAYSKALVEAWTSKIVSLAQDSFFEENGEDNGWFDRQLREASHRRRQDGCGGGQEHRLLQAHRCRRCQILYQAGGCLDLHLQAGFLTWARRQKLRVNKGNLDAMVVKYMTYMHEREGAEPRVGSYLIYGLQLLQCDIPKALFLPNAKETLASWRMLKRGCMQLPVPEELIFDVAVQLSQSRLDFMCLLLLQFDGCRRHSEAIELTWDNVVEPVGRWYPWWALVLFPAEMQARSKTGKADDSIRLGNRKWMTQVMNYLHKRTEHRLFPNISLAQFERILHNTCGLLEYSSPVVLPHIVRHSSASNDACHRRRDLRATQKRGRWAAKSSVNRYEKHGLLQRAWKFVKSQVEKAKQRLVSVINTRLK